jgi:intein-encoded DNA endonuclease-like protein
MEIVMRSKWTKEEEKFLINNYKKMTYAEIGHNLGFKDSAVGYKLKKLGLKKGKGQWQSPVNKKPANSNYFKTWTEKSAYILGFIVADGHVQHKDRNRLVIGLSIKDLKTLELIRDELCPTANIRHYKKRNTIYLAVGDKEMIADLVSLGLGNLKGKVVDIFDKIPKEQMRHFIRGFFDGDGCISYQERFRQDKYYSVEGTVKFTNGDKNLLDKVQEIIGFGRVSFKQFKTRSWYDLVSAKTSHIFSFYDYLYLNANIYMMRKKRKFESFIKLKPNKGV